LDAVAANLVPSFDCIWSLYYFYLCHLKIKDMNSEIPAGIIELEEMEFYAYHGCFREENVVGNRFLVNMAICTDMARAMRTDKIDDALNYVKVYDLVRVEMQQTSNLLEHVSARIIDSLFRHFSQINWARVKVSKMNPPMGGQMKKVSVTLERKNTV
jgi:dihydroneopterin aldolase